MEIPNQDLKKCSKCGEEKSLKEFYKQHAFNARNKFTAVMAECKVCVRKRSYARKHGEKSKEIKKKGNAYSKAQNLKFRDAAFAAYGGYKCVCCGETEPLFMTLDHINNDGADFRRNAMGRRTAAGHHTYRRLFKNGYPEGIQVLCMNCNHGKRMNNETCPHQVRCNDQDVELSDSKRTAPKITKEALSFLHGLVLTKDTVTRTYL